MCVCVCVCVCHLNHSDLCYSCVIIAKNPMYPKVYRVTAHSTSLNSNPLFFLCLNTSFVFTNYQPGQCNASYRAYIVDWSLIGIMTSKLVIREIRIDEAAVIIPYRISCFTVCCSIS